MDSKCRKWSWWDMFCLVFFSDLLHEAGVVGGNCLWGSAEVLAHIVYHLPREERRNPPIKFCLCPSTRRMFDISSIFWHLDTGCIFFILQLDFDDQHSQGDRNMIRLDKKALQKPGTRVGEWGPIFCTCSLHDHIPEFRVWRPMLLNTHC